VAGRVQRVGGKRERKERERADSDYVRAEQRGEERVRVRGVQW